jgi:hypothetical protein
MLKKTMLLTGATLLAGCASQPAAPPPPPSPPPVEIAESAPAESPHAVPDIPPAPESPPDTPQKPAQTDTGRFRISVASLDTVEAAQPWVRKAEAAGYRTEILAVDIDGTTWQRVLLPGYASLADAQAALPFVQQELGAPTAWVTSRRRAPVPADAAAPPPPPAPADMPTPPPAPEAPAPEQPAN